MTRAAGDRSGTSETTALCDAGLSGRVPAPKALLTLTHDVRFAEKLAKTRESQRKRVLETLPEVRVRRVSDAEVVALNKGHASHAHRWIYTPGKVDWASDLLAQPSMTPKLMDLSGRDLMHFQSRVTYDPKMDSAR